MPSQRTTALSRRLARRAFTLIELVIVIAIIAILLGFLIVGYRYVGIRSQERQTRALLERLRNVSTGVFSNAAASQKFFQVQVPYVYSEPVGGNSVDAANDWDAVPANANDSLYRTALVLKTLLVDPQAKALFDDLPTERKKVYYFNTSIPSYAPVAAGTTGAAGPFTLPLDAWGNPILFVFDNWQVPTGAGLTTPKQMYSATAQTAGGLTDLYSATNKQFYELTTRRVPKDPNYAQKYTTHLGVTDFTSAGLSFRAPDQRPFWASAGPDGDYSTQDDNVYSFEN